MDHFSVTGMWASMGLVARAVIVVLLSMSALSLYISLDRITTYLRVQRSSLDYVRDLGRLLGTQDLKGAVDRSALKPQSPIARIASAALLELGRGQEILRGRQGASERGFDVLELVQLTLIRVKEREVAELRRGLSSLASFASAAPFIGLFGTVVGIIDAFKVMAATGEGGIGAISSGIAEALMTTAVGLFVAIPAVLAHNYLNGRVEDLVVDMNDASSEIVAFVVTEGTREVEAVDP
ncbi:MAG: MotA/TolQ/ExbB proton channel family protein [Deltaproteobacteria bacterium]|nr:MotA/TolQ/ExbB proton channel family protein [Deltaproteobacteria bacterium]